MNKLITAHLYLRTHNCVLSKNTLKKQCCGKSLQSLPFVALHTPRHTDGPLDLRRAANVYNDIRVPLR